MGKHNSTLTRVIPVFDRLYKDDKTGSSWLPRLLHMPIGGNSIKIPNSCNFTIERKGWGKDEVKLDPPVSLLSWLIRHPRYPTVGEISSDPVKAKKRQELIDGAAKRLWEALSLLSNNPNKEDWHIFEGQTQPDVYLQTKDFIVVIEGKRTEREPTTTTKWMPARHQMLRHIDCAWEIAGKRQVIGFFIVEGNGADEAVPAQWIEFAKQTASLEAVSSSLPHRGPEEQAGISACFFGVTTWQRVCKEFGIEWASLPRETG
jgi:hypothetical protein